MPGSALRICRYARKWTWLLYALALFVGTHIPIPETFDELVTVWDKVIHAGAYFGLGSLTAAAFFQAAPPRVPVVSMTVGLLGYAALDELLQGFVGRSPDPTDWMSDAAGILLAMCLAQLVVVVVFRHHGVPSSCSRDRTVATVPK